MSEELTNYLNNLVYMVNVYSDKLEKGLCLEITKILNISVNAKILSFYIIEIA